MSNKKGNMWASGDSNTKSRWNDEKKFDDKRKPGGNLFSVVFFGYIDVI